MLENESENGSVSSAENDVVYIDVDATKADLDVDVDVSESEPNDAEAEIDSKTNGETGDAESEIDAPTVDADGAPAPATLEEALAKYGIKLSAKKVRLLKEYCELLWTWNERLNLTRHDDFEKFVTRDLVDSMELAKLFQKGEHVLDVGSGGGVPGLVLAILRPDITVELCEATGKKAEALGAIVDALGLDLNVWYAKAEDLLRAHRFHTLTIRAVGKLHKLLQMFAPVWFAFDRILTIKGPTWVGERGEARHYNALNNIALRKVAEYANPGADNDSVILQLCRKSKFELIETRVQERLEGKPIGLEVEPVEVDNKPRDLSEGGAERGGRERRGGDRRFGSNRGPKSRDGRAYVDARDRREEAGANPTTGENSANSLSSATSTKPTTGASEAASKTGSNDGSTRVFARRNGKAPKGWTGKKREFRPDGGANDGARSADGEKRGFGRRSGESRGEFGKGRDASGKTDKFGKFDKFGGGSRSNGRFGGRPAGKFGGGKRFGGRSNGRHNGRSGGESRGGSAE